MPQDPGHLIWIDMEMTGLIPETDRIIEIALVVTDVTLATVAEAPVLVVHQNDVTLAAMDSWNQSTHGRTGLTAKVKASVLDEAAAEQQMLRFNVRASELACFVPRKKYYPACFFRVAFKHRPYRFSLPAFGVNRRLLSIHLDRD